MSDTGLVLSLFSALAVLAVGAILGAAIWARARSSARDRRELALETPAGDPAMSWLVSTEDSR